MHIEPTECIVSALSESLLETAEFNRRIISKEMFSSEMTIVRYERFFLVGLIENNVFLTYALLLHCVG